MSTRLTVPRSRLAPICALIVLLLGIQSVSLARPGVNAADQEQDQQLLSSVVEAMTLIEDNYAGELDYDRLTESSIDHMLGTLDPHSHFWNREEFLDFRNRQASQYSGVGATIVPHNGKIYILAPFADTPALHAGLRYGDLILEIDGKSTEGWNVDQVRNNLRGLRGTPVSVKVSRPGVAEPITYRVVRDSVDLPSVTNSFLIRPGVGYIGLRREFQRTTGDEFTQALKTLKARGAGEIIVDLRGNPGGLVESARVVVDQLLYRGQKILSYKGRGKSGLPIEQEFKSTNPEPDTSPLVVLVNNGSASASEIVAGAIQDQDRGLVIGENSFGKGLVQTIFQLPGGYGLTLTSAKYLTPSGRLIQRSYDGVSPYEYQKQGITGTSTRPPVGPDFQTTTKRTVKGGSGIEPDVKVGPSFFTQHQVLLLDATFAFGRQLVNGQVPDCPEYVVTGMQFQHVLTDTDFPVSDKLVQAFTKFVEARGAEYQVTPAMVRENLEFVKQQLRAEVVTAAHGSETANEIQIASDGQVLKAITELTNARLLAEKSRKAWLESGGAANVGRNTR